MDYIQFRQTGFRVLAYRLTNQTHSLTGDILGKEQAVIFMKVRKKPLNSCTATEHKKAHVSRWVKKRSPPNRSRSSQSEQALIPLFLFPRRGFGHGHHANCGVNTVVEKRGVCLSPPNTKNCWHSLKTARGRKDSSPRAWAESWPF